MKKHRVIEKGYTWMYYPSHQKTDKAMIVALGGSDNDLMVKGTAKYFTQLGCDVAAICPKQFDKKYTGYHKFPLECIEEVVKWLDATGHHKIGMAGGSTTAIVALLAASYISNLSLILVYSPADFVMQGFYRGKKDGYIPEWPAKGESIVSYRGQNVPFSPFHLEDKAYYDMSFGRSTKDEGEVNCLALFQHVESQPQFERGLIKVEQIKAIVHAFGAEDDTLWETTKYIKRIEERLAGKETTCKFYAHCYEKGTHFVFPQSMLKNILPVGINLLIGKMFRSGKAYPRECEYTRYDIDRITREAVNSW